MVFHRLQKTPLLVKRFQRLGLLMVHLETRLDGLGGIVFPLDQFAAAVVAHAGRLGGHSYQMVAGPAGLTDTASAHALHNGLVRDFDGNHVIKGDSRLLHGFCLGDGAGHPVQNIAVPAILLRQTLGDDTDDHFIRHQLAGIHIGLGLEPGGRAILDGSPKDVSGGDGRNVQLFAQALGLSAFAGARSAQ